MSVPEQATVEVILLAHVEALRRIVLGAWQRWRETVEAPLYREPRTRANIMWEHMTRLAEEAFVNDGRVRIKRQPQTVWFVFEERLTLRFKKGDERGISSNIPTQLALAYHDPQLSLPGFMPIVQRVEVVYVLNALETALAGIWIVARNGAKVAWRYEIPIVSLTAAPVIELPVTPVLGTPAHHLVKPRTPAEDKRDDNESRKE